MLLLIHCSGGASWLTWLGGRRFVAAVGTEGELNNLAGSHRDWPFGLGVGRQSWIQDAVALPFPKHPLLFL